MGAQTHITMHSAAYQKVENNKADIIVALGGDGLTLHALEIFKNYCFDKNF